MQEIVAKYVEDVSWKLKYVENVNILSLINHLCLQYKYLRVTEKLACKYESITDFILLEKTPVSDHDSQGPIHTPTFAKLMGCVYLVSSWHQITSIKNTQCHK